MAKNDESSQGETTKSRNKHLRRFGTKTNPVNPYAPVIKPMTAITMMYRTLETVECVSSNSNSNLGAHGRFFLMTHVAT